MLWRPGTPGPQTSEAGRCAASFTSLQRCRPDGDVPDRPHMGALWAFTQAHGRTRSRGAPRVGARAQTKLTRTVTVVLSVPSLARIKREPMFGARLAMCRVTMAPCLHLTPRPPKSCSASGVERGVHQVSEMVRHTPPGRRRGPVGRTPSGGVIPRSADSARSRGGQQQARGEAPEWPPVSGEVCHLGRAGEVVEAAARLYRVAQG